MPGTVSTAGPAANSPACAAQSMAINAGLTAWARTRFCAFKESPGKNGVASCRAARLAPHHVAADRLAGAADDQVDPGLTGARARAPRIAVHAVGHAGCGAVVQPFGTHQLRID